VFCCGRSEGIVTPCIAASFVWMMSLLAWGPNKFPPFSWITYTLPSLALLLMMQQLLSIRCPPPLPLACFLPMLFCRRSSLQFSSIDDGATSPPSGRMAMMPLGSASVENNLL